MALMTLPPLRQRVHTYARVGEPLRRTRTLCRFGSKRRLVATIECERWLPKPGFFPQIAQILLIAVGSVAIRDYWVALARSRAKRSAISSAERTASAAL